MDLKIRSGRRKTRIRSPVFRFLLPKSARGVTVENYFATLSHFWLATVQLVLQADWHEVWHSPQALPSRGTRMEEVEMVFTCSIGAPPRNSF
jgi:hypothetical protein